MIYKFLIPSNTVKYSHCNYCGAEFIVIKPDDIHIYKTK